MSKTQTAPLEIPSEAPAISEKQREGRAVNAVAELLMHKLLVPKIYLEPKGLKIFIKPKLDLKENQWADVLAIDRAGSGDIHAVHIFLRPMRELGEQHAQSYIQFYLRKKAIHFKYLAVNSESIDFVSKQSLFAEDGIGRVGIVEIIETPSAPPKAKIVIPAERFRVAPDWIKKFDNFQKKTPADMEFRG